MTDPRTLVSDLSELCRKHNVKIDTGGGVDDAHLEIRDCASGELVIKCDRVEPEGPRSISAPRMHIHGVFPILKRMLDYPD